MFDRNNDGTFRSREERWRAMLRFILGGIAVLVGMISIGILLSEGQFSAQTAADSLELIIDGLKAMGEAISPTMVLCYGL